MTQQLVCLISLSRSSRAKSHVVALSKCIFVTDRYALALPDWYKFKEGYHSAGEQLPITMVQSSEFVPTKCCPHPPAIKHGQVLYMRRLRTGSPSAQKLSNLFVPQYTLSLNPQI